MTHQLDGAFARVNRAAEHIAELKGTVDIFQQAYHDAVASQFDSDLLDQPDPVVSAGVANVPKAPRKYPR